MLRLSFQISLHFYFFGHRLLHSLSFYLSIYLYISVFLPGWYSIVNSSLKVTSLSIRINMRFLQATIVLATALASKALAQKAVYAHFIASDHILLGRTAWLTRV